MAVTHIAWVYILTNKTHTTLYVGFTTSLSTRIWEHQTKQNRGSFTARYNINKLVYYKGYHSVSSAESVEQYLKGKSRAWKEMLIKSMNPEWHDLSEKAKLE